AGHARSSPGQTEGQPVTKAVRGGARRVGGDRLSSRCHHSDPASAHNQRSLTATRTLASMADVTADGVASGFAALAQVDWPAARDAFTAALADGDAPEPLMGLANARDLQLAAGYARRTGHLRQLRRPRDHRPGEPCCRVTGTTSTADSRRPAAER